MNRKIHLALETYNPMNIHEGPMIEVTLPTNERDEET